MHGQNQMDFKQDNISGKLKLLNDQLENFPILNYPYGHMDAPPGWKDRVAPVWT